MPAVQLVRSSSDKVAMLMDVEPEHLSDAYAVTGASVLSSTDDPRSSGQQTKSSSNLCKVAAGCSQWSYGTLTGFCNRRSSE